jgi:hypothetical protein
MSIRNKRLIREIPRLDYNLIWDDDWETKNLAIVKTVRSNMLISLSLEHTYPFHCPLLCVHPNSQEKGIEYISWFLKQNIKFKQMKDELNIGIPCICCYSLTCSWTPSLGIKDMIKEFDTHYKLYMSFVKFHIIYNKIVGFDNLIYQRIFHFLY